MEQQPAARPPADGDGRGQVEASGVRAGTAFGPQLWALLMGARPPTDGPSVETPQARATQGSRGAWEAARPPKIGGRQDALR